MTLRKKLILTSSLMLLSITSMTAWAVLNRQVAQWVPLQTKATTYHTAISTKKVNIKKVRRSKTKVAKLAKKTTTPDTNVYQLGVKAYQCAHKLGYSASSMLAIIDYSKPATQRRLWIYDMAKKRLVANQLVAHGSGSGQDTATHFSNKDGTHESSIGVYVTKETYHGKHGLSLRLQGLDKGFNDHAMSRAIVMHGANYVGADFVARYGHLGKSFGCLAVDKNKSATTINQLKGGSVILAYYPDNSWLHQSKFLHC